MTDHVCRVAAQIDAIVVPLARQRIDVMGLEESGAGAFYKVRLDRDTLFTPSELGLARSLLAWPRAPRRVHEIGGGFGGMSLLLSALGFAVTCVELDAKRHAGAASFLAALVADPPGLSGFCEMINARFPSSKAPAPSEDALALITNLVCTTTPEAKAAMLGALARYPFAIIDIDRFLVQLLSPADRVARIGEFAASGLVGQPFLDLGVDACLYRFSGAPRGASA